MKKSALRLVKNTALIVLLMISSTYAQTRKIAMGLSCSQYSQNPTVFRICNSDKLYKLDQQMQQQYLMTAMRISRNMPKTQAAKRQFKQLLYTVHKKFVTSLLQCKSSSSCIKRKYNGYIDTLKNLKLSQSSSGSGSRPKVVGLGIPCKSGARHPSINLICNTPSLYQLDQKMKMTFLQASMRIGRSMPKTAEARSKFKALIKKVHGNFIRQLLQCGRNSNCIKTTYRRYLATLQNLQLTTSSQTMDNSDARMLDELDADTKNTTSHSHDDIPNFAPQSMQKNPAVKGYSWGGDVYTEPSDTSEKLGTIEDRQTITILEISTKKKYNLPWFKIKSGGITGWMWGGNLCAEKPYEKQSACEAE